jgi:hypothetical protein
MWDLRHWLAWWKHKCVGSCKGVDTLLELLLMLAANIYPLGSCHFSMGSWFLDRESSAALVQGVDGFDIPFEALQRLHHVADVSGLSFRF